VLLAAAEGKALHKATRPSLLPAAVLHLPTVLAPGFPKITTIHASPPPSPYKASNSLLSQASLLTVLLFAPYPQPCGASDKEQKKALIERPINVHETGLFEPRVRRWSPWKPVSLVVCIFI